MNKFLCIIGLAALLSGCGTTSPATTAFKITGVTIAAVNTAEDYWGNYVRAGLATPAQQAQVRQAVGQYDAAMELYKQAVILTFIASTNGTTPGPDAGTLINQSQAARDALVNVIASFLPADQAAQFLSPTP